jgi:hypothetical protein
VGNRFLEMGQRTRGRRYLTLADRIDLFQSAAGFENTAVDDAVPSGSQPVSEPSADNLPALPSAGGEQTLKALFERYVRGLTSENTDLTISVMAHIMILPGYETALNPEQQKTFFNEFFAVYPCDSLTFESFYDKTTLDITMFEPTRGLLTVLSQKESPPELADWKYWDSFWGSRHYYFFEIVGGEWKMIAFDISAEN